MNIKIEQDKPFFKNYAVHFLKFAREAENRVSSMTDALKEKDPDGEIVSQDNGSNSSVQVKSSIDFWQELETSLKIMLGDSQFSVHRQGGIISFMGTTRQHKMVNEYLTQLEHVTGAQVLIEAKIIEVALNQEFQSGINWQMMDGENPLFSSNFFNEKEEGSSLVSANFKSDSFSLLLRSLEKFGSLRVVSSPRITVLNNQTAVIKVAEMRFILRSITKPASWVGCLKTEHSTTKSSAIATKPLALVK